MCAAVLTGRPQQPCGPATGRAAKSRGRRTEHQVERDQRLLALREAAGRVLRADRGSKREEAAMHHVQCRYRALPLWLALVSVVSADIVERKSGARLEGTLKQATPAGVGIEVGGETLRVAPEKVRAIYFEAAPSAPAPASARDAALRALRVLQAVTRDQLTDTEYAREVTATKDLGDHYLQEPTEPGSREVRAAMAEAATTSWRPRRGRPRWAGGITPLSERTRSSRGVPS